ncbi:MAG: CDP-diacylglycerol--glycerol-3-phosphate 3-phosphatidyltransferase [Bdellovibrionota bacterium]
MDKTKWLRDLPNQLTLFRIAIVPLLLLLFPLDFRPLKLFCAFMFALAAISDWLDGFIARRYDSITKLGKILDPIADKILTAAALVLLTDAQVIYAWVAGLFLCRELAVSGLRHMAAQQQIEIQVSPLGKWKTFILDVALTCMMVNEPLFGWPWVEVGMICLWTSLLISLYSAWEYGTKFWKMVKF